MKYHYPVGTTRWFRWTGQKDVRLHRPPKGWQAQAGLIERHPSTDKPFKESQWWVLEKYMGE